MNETDLSIHFIGEPIDVFYKEEQIRFKTPSCPDGFYWEGNDFQILSVLSQWVDYGRQGKMQHNMKQAHLDRAKKKGSWGVGRFYFKVQVDGDRVFTLYYDRAPGGSKDRKGKWILMQEFL